jgi:hypothetical protein
MTAAIAMITDTTERRGAAEKLKPESQIHAVKQVNAAQIETCTTNAPAANSCSDRGCGTSPIAFAIAKSTSKPPSGDSATAKFAAMVLLMPRSSCPSPTPASDPLLLLPRLVRMPGRIAHSLQIIFDSEMVGSRKHVRFWMFGSGATDVLVGDCRIATLPE